MLEIMILLLAGLLAGIVTGLFGASAVIISAPILIIFLGFQPYAAIGLSLAIDIFASLSATLIYYKEKRIEIKPTLILLLFAIIFTLIGSWFSVFVPQSSMSIATGIAIAIIGLSLVLKQKKSFLTSKKFPFLHKNKTLSLITLGSFIGIIAGVFGAGGGMIILAALVLVLDYKIHNAIGTAVFLMIFIALFGAAGHFYFIPFSFKSLAIAAIGGVIGAAISSILANKLKEKTLNRLVGILIILLGISLTIKNLI
ncbi:MAG: sulfite exporter TauE/SafE family protein [archaeon]